MRLCDSVQITCDSCAKHVVFRDGMTIRVADLRHHGPRVETRGIVDRVLTWTSGRPTAEILNALVVAGWKLTTARNVDGEYDSYIVAEQIPHKARVRSFFATCPDCSSWVPPFSAAAARELARIRLATGQAADAEVARLRAEVDRLRSVVDDIQRTARPEAVAS